MAKCNRCDYILYARQAVNNSKIKDTKIVEKAVQDFISNNITFHDMCLMLGLTEEIISSIIPDRELHNRRIDDA